MNPSIIKNVYPWSSVLQNSEAETVAKNIITILSRTGDEWRSLTWEEYKTERLKDGYFTEKEKDYFEDVSDYTVSPQTARLFSGHWKEAIDAN